MSRTCERASGPGFCSSPGGMLVLWGAFMCFRVDSCIKFVLLCGIMMFQSDYLYARKEDA